MAPTDPGGRTPKDKPFPWRCTSCRQKAVRPALISYRTEILHDDQLHPVEVPQLEVPRCENCGELVFDNHASDQIYRALRVQLRLLMPEQIRFSREALGLSEKELAGRLGVSERAVADWENDLMVQSRTVDNLLRLYFGLPQVRSALVGLIQDPQFGTCAVQ
jgi:putative zinc finger/helix-turn-helix YgiT family protein